MKLRRPPPRTERQSAVALITMMDTVTRSGATRVKVIRIEAQP